MTWAPHVSCDVTSFLERKAMTSSCLPYETKTVAQSGPGPSTLVRTPMSSCTWCSCGALQRCKTHLHRQVDPRGHETRNAWLWHDRSGLYDEETMRWCHTTAFSKRDRVSSCAGSRRLLRHGIDSDLCLARCIEAMLYLLSDSLDI